MLDKTRNLIPIFWMACWVVLVVEVIFCAQVYWVVWEVLFHDWSSVSVCSLTILAEGLEAAHTQSQKYLKEAEAEVGMIPLVAARDKQSTVMRGERC